MTHASSVNSTIKEIFDYSKKVYCKQIRASEAAYHLNGTFDINVNSAKICFRVYKQLIDGNEFTRALSVPDMDYYLSRIMEENGIVQLQTSVKALWLHIDYYENKANVNLNALRKVAKKYEHISNKIETLESIDREFWSSVNNSLKLPEDLRRKRLESASAKPETIETAVQIFKRNPDVVAEVLFRANGKCELCGCKAPFIRKKDNTPYLEVHHRDPLSSGGPDTVDNALALCPNCHRKIHFGI